jgi:uncharacterized protein (TIGR02679 family)
MRDNHGAPDIQRAVTFFTQANLTRLLGKLRDKYIELGRVGGQITLEDTTPGERREIASFIGKAPYRETDIKVRLVDVDRALRLSGFACELPELLNAFFPDKPLVTRPQQRAMRAIHQTDFRAALVSIAMELPEDSRGRHWLLHGQHGQDWLFSHYKNEPLDEQDHQLNILHYVVSALDQLPPSSSPERLALFAQRISGDPHIFDPDRAEGRLFRHALLDLVDISGGTSSQERIPLSDLYTNAGLLVDTISSNVAAFNLAGAIYQNGMSDPLLQAVGERVLLLPLRQLLEWQSVQAAMPDIYVFENPQVFEEVIAGLTHSNIVKALPTLVCTSGWPSTAALLLLDLLLSEQPPDQQAQSPANCLHYSGDYDLAGLKIATYLLERYPGRCHLWRFDPESYVKTLHDEGVPANTADLAALSNLPGVFAPLVAMMQEKGKWAYQEGIAQLLIEDVRRRQSEA